ncbi:hypothetical protein BY458DRAFT_559631 [Sporodiniella umbellata]|nr:hypothetical protein BY458DRAFT_559631 [Sporodiniella umbellata]
MFLCRRLITKSARNDHFEKRFGSSSCGNSSKEEEIQAKQNDKTAKNKEIVEKLQFMPVVNIPENELAFNAFFSLHRPLLGLSNNRKRSFFAARSIEEEQEAESDEALFRYMSTLEHFSEPSAPGSPDYDKQIIPESYNFEQEEPLLEVNDSFQTSDEHGNTKIESMESDIQIQYTPSSSLPIFRMPESGDVVDFLSTVEGKMKQEGLILEQQQKLRLKKSEILNNSRQYPLPRFYTSGLRRFQKKKQ